LEHSVYVFIQHSCTKIAVNYLQQHRLITKDQHGFLTKISTATNLLESLNDWTLNIEKKNHQSVANIDFAKAFDSVRHSQPLIKLTAYGIIHVVHC